jgi:hypothetical protein
VIPNNITGHKDSWNLSEDTVTETKHTHSHYNPFRELP